MLKCNKKAQVGETITWVVATIVIIGVMIIFLFISSLMAKLKSIGIGDLNPTLEKSNPLTTKTSLAEQLNSQNKDTIENILNKNNNG